MPAAASSMLPGMFARSKLYFDEEQDGGTSTKRANIASRPDLSR